MPLKILVTGGAGFIGSHLVRALVAEGHEVVVVDSMEWQVHGPYPPDPEGPFEFIKGTVPDAFHDRKPYDVVFHLAALVGVGQAQYQVAPYVIRNVTDTAWMLQAFICSEEYRPKRLIVASSMSIYGEAPEAWEQESIDQYGCRGPGLVAADPLPGGGTTFRPAEKIPRAVRETDPITVPNVYAQTKYDQERYCLLFGDAYNVPTVAARFFNVYGPGQSLSNPYTGVAAIFAACLLAGIDAPIFDDGLQTRDFIHVSDIVSGLMAMLHAPAETVAGEAINLGTGSAMSLLGLYAMLGQAIGKPRAPLPTGIKRKGDIRHCHADITKARQLLGWSPRVTLARGIEEYAEWLATQDVSGVLERVEQMRRELAEKGLVST